MNLRVTISTLSTGVASRLPWTEGVGGWVGMVTEVPGQEVGYGQGEVGRGAHWAELTFQMLTVTTKKSHQNFQVCSL